MKVFMQHEDYPGRPWGVSASIDEVNPQYRAEVAGEDLGTFATLEEARAALDERMRSRFGIGA